jgi:phospho-N-acetylmuramoyl-pentapeptide-transferase
MIYHIAQVLQEKYSFLNVFRYVSVRSICALLTSLFIAFAFGGWFIRFCQKNFRSKVREWTPDSHQAKNDTPTMGGLFVILIFFINAMLWTNLSKINVWLFLLCVLGYGLIGFWDDVYKIKYKKGISSALKFRLQIVLGLILSTAWYFLLNPDARICIPFFKNFMPDIGFLLIPWAVLIIVSTSNAVNLTDGLDGLAAGPLIFSFSTYAFIAYLAGHVKFANYLYIPYAGSADLTILACALVGALIGFLWYNTYPAQIFMGDVGSLAMGAALAFLALFVRQELLLLLCGGIFVLETVSVILQVASFKLRGKRIFLMAPIHHHFELKGWKEAKVTVRFWIISMILCLFALLTLKLR